MDEQQRADQNRREAVQFRNALEIIAEGDSGIKPEIIAQVALGELPIGALLARANKLPTEKHVRLEQKLIHDALDLHEAINGRGELTLTIVAGLTRPMETQAECVIECFYSAANDLSREIDR